MISKTFFARAVPFAVFVVGGSFFLKQFASLRYEFRKGKILSPEEATAYGLNMMDVDKVSKQMLKEVQEEDFDEWQNIRGPRPWEDSKTFQTEERQRLEKK